MNLASGPMSVVATVWPQISKGGTRGDTLECGAQVSRTICVDTLVALLHGSPPMGFLLSLLARMARRGWVRAGANAYMNSDPRRRVAKSGAAKISRAPRIAIYRESRLSEPDLPDDLTRRIDLRVRREIRGGTYDGPAWAVNQGRGALVTSRAHAAVKSNGGLRGGATRTWRRSG